jgi:hypothetical protein
MRDRALRFPVQLGEGSREQTPAAAVIRVPPKSNKGKRGKAGRARKGKKAAQFACRYPSAPGSDPVET